MDSQYMRDGFKVDIIDKDWILDKIPNANVNVPIEELPDTELNDLNAHHAQTVREMEMKWSENGLQQTWVIINS